MSASYAPAAVEIAASGLEQPFAVAVARDGAWYVAEYSAHRVTRIDKDGKRTVVAGTGEPGELKNPHSLALAADGRLFIADTFNHRIRVLDTKTGRLTTIAGTGEPGFSGDGGPAAAAQFNETYSIDLSRDGKRLYVDDLKNRRIRMIDLASGTITTVAGNGESAVPQDGAKAVDSPLTEPRAVAVGPRGELYVLERKGNALRIVDPGGKIRTLIKPGDFQPDLNGPKHLTVDGKGDVLIADTENHVIRRYDTKRRTLTTILGTGKSGSAVTELARPHGVTVTSNGNLLISDSENNRILRID